MAFEIRGEDTRRGMLYTHGNMTYGARLRGRVLFWGARVFKKKDSVLLISMYILPRLFDKSACEV